MMQSSNKYIDNIIYNKINQYKLMLISFSFFILAIYLHGKDFYGIDLDVWRKDADRIVDCIQNFAPTCDDLSKFPLGYTINAFVMRFFQIFGIFYEKTFTIINFIFSTIPIWFILLVRGVNKFKIIVPVYIFSILSSALFPFYIYSGAVELQSAVILGIFSASLCLILQSNDNVENVTLERFLYFSSLLLPLYKDTNLIVIIAGLVNVCLFYFVFYKINLLKKIMSSKSIRVAAFFLMIGLGLQIFYNYFKYRSFMPISYLNEAAHNAPSYYKSVEYLFWTIFSPNGGVLCFWSFAFFTTLLLIKMSKMMFSRISIIYSCSIILISVIGLTRWWGPFGWDCWGDRLIIPAIFGSLICLVLTADSGSEEITLYSSKAYIDIINFNYLRGEKIHFSFGSFYLIICFLVCYSAYYTFISYFYDRNELLKNSLFNFASCRALTEAYNANASPSNIFQSHFYYDCVTDRFKYIPL